MRLKIITSMKLNGPYDWVLEERKDLKWTLIEINMKNLRDMFAGKCIQ
jgi:hypothetical protein